MRKLTAKQQRFVDEYLVDLNATQAAIRAGYSEKTARVIASENLLKPDIVVAVQAAQEARAKRTQVDADWLLNRLHGELEADLAELYAENGDLKPIHQWPKVFRKGLVAGIETEQTFETVDGKKVPAGVIHKVKLIDRSRQEQMIGKHVTVGAFVERHEHTGKDGGPIQTEEISETERARRIAFVLSKATRETVQ